MLGAGIHPGDILVVDRSLDPANNSVIIAAVNGDLTVKRLVKTGARASARPRHERYRPIEIREGMDFRGLGRGHGRHPRPLIAARKACIGRYGERNEWHIRWIGWYSRW